jgi:8-oxo-dGTP pyrophosphatase MutT (NUDIX family)
VSYRRGVPHRRRESLPELADARVDPTDPGRRLLDAPGSARTAPAPRPPWTDLAAAGWRPTLTDIRRGFAGTAAGRPAAPLVRPSRSSAVLLPLVPAEGGQDDASIVLIERSRTTGTHRGDIAFPGGVLDDGESPEEAALREAHEEIGILPGDVDVIASLDMVPTLTAFLISPFVGVLGRRPSFVVQRAEIERVLVVPLADLIEEGAHWYQAWNSDPRSVQPFFAIGDGVGWGTTGALLIHLLTAAAAGHRLEAR